MRGLALIPVLICAFLLLACKDDHPVRSCEPGGGLELDNSSAPRWGPASAPVELAVFGDLECPHTKNLVVALSGFTDRLTADGKQAELTIVFRHLLRSSGSEYRSTAISIAAAHRQGDPFIWGSAGHLGMLWCYVFAQIIDEQQIVACAEGAGLDMEQFARDRQDEGVAAVVERDLAEGRRIGFEGVPGVVLCGVHISSDPDEVIDNLEYLLYE